MPSTVTLPFSLPPPRAGDPPPVWNGSGFDLGGAVVPYLSYRQAASGWSEDMSLLLLENGPDRPFAVASRRHALAWLWRLVNGKASPVVLEIGSADGSFVRAAKDRLPGACIIASEWSALAARTLSETLAGIPVLQMDLCDCPIPDHSVDALVALNVLEHIIDDGLAMRRIAAVLKPGGHALIEVPADPDLFDAFDEHVGHQRRYTMAGLTGLCAAAGLNVTYHTHLGMAIFPVFRWIKRRTRLRRGALDEAGRKAVVEKAMRQTKRNHLLAIALALDALVRRLLPERPGIRAFVICRKPEKSL